jgi:hypothetical protein
MQIINMLRKPHEILSDAAKGIEMLDKIYEIVCKFYYRGLEEEELTDAILENRNEIILAFGAKFASIK